MKQPDKAGTVIGFIVFTFFVIVGLTGSITSTFNIYTFYTNGEYGNAVIWFFFGLLYVYWFVYFTKELYQLIKIKR